jgi:hypothetical protein
VPRNRNAENSKEMLWFRELEYGVATQPIQGILIFKNTKAKYLYCHSI